VAARDLLGFTRSAAWRLAGAGAYLIAAGALLVAIQARGAGRPPGAPPAAPAPSPASSPAPRGLTLTLTATYAVARWTVELDGVAQLPSAATAQDWHGRIAPRSPGAEIYIHGEAADPLGSAPCALRVAVTDGGAGVRSEVLWGEGSVSARVAALPAAAGR
jgi:hypothetical protein